VSEPLEILSDTRDLIAALPDKLAQVLRPQPPERLPISETGTNPIPVKVEQAEVSSDKTMPSPPVSMPTQQPVVINQLPIPQKPDIPTAKTDVRPPQIERYEKTERVVDRLPSVIPDRMPASPPSGMPVIQESSQPVAQSPVFPSQQAQAADSKSDKLSSEASSRGNDELGGKIDELIDAVRSLTNAMSEQRPTGHKGGASTVHYVAPDKQQKQSAPSRKSFMGNLFGG
jgi:hypothetical protein